MELDLQNANDDHDNGGGEGVFFDDAAEAPLPAAASDVNGSGGGRSESRRPQEKRKRSGIPNPKKPPPPPPPSQPEVTTTVASSTSLTAASPSTLSLSAPLPPEVVGLVGSYCTHRSSIRNLAVTSKSNWKAVERMVPEQPWPTKCFFAGTSARCRGNLRLDKVVFSRDGARVAVIKESVRLDRPGKIEIWDKKYGLIGTVVCRPYLLLKPVFSPDGRMLLVKPKQRDAGITLVQLSPPAEKWTNPEIFQLQLGGANVTSIDFVDDQTISFTEFRTNDVKSFRIVERLRNEITVTEPRMTFQDPRGRRGHGNGMMASYKGEEKDFLVFLYDSEDRVLIFHDRRRNVSVISRPFGDRIRDMQFSPDGNKLVTAHGAGKLSVYNFDATPFRIERIGDPRIVRVRSSTGIEPGMFYHSLSFSPFYAGDVNDGSHGSVRTPHADRLRRRRRHSVVSVMLWKPSAQTRNNTLRLSKWFQIIDIEKGTVLCDTWDGTSWKTLLNVENNP